MHRYLFICLTFCFPLLVAAQDFINDSPARVKKKLEQYLEKNAFHSVIRQTDSVISLTIEDSSVKPATFIFHFFDQKCMEEIKLSCDTCVIKYLNGNLQNRSMDWKKVNEVMWVSKYSKRRIMILDVNGDRSSLRIRKTNWDKNTYKGIIASLD
jgi:hypothetical protein